MTEKEHGSVAMGDSTPKIKNDPSEYVTVGMAQASRAADLEKALDAYWNVAYQQGQETRGHDDEHGTAQKAEDGLRAAIAALARPVQEPVAVVRHKKRGSTYEVIGIGNMQSETWEDMTYQHQVTSVDMRKVAVYRSTEDGLIWVRPIEEFEDGRFELVTAAPQPAHGTSATERDTPAPTDLVRGPSNRKAALFTLSEWLPAFRPDELEILLYEVEQALATASEGSNDEA